MTYEELLQEVDGAQNTVGEHTLVVVEACCDDGGYWYIEHSPECVQRMVAAGDDYGVYYCPFRFELDNRGSDAFDIDVETLPDGIYPVVWWHLTSYHWEYGSEHESGIAVGV